MTVFARILHRRAAFAAVFAAVSTIGGGVLWLAEGNIAPLMRSIREASAPGSAEALADLPRFQADVISRLDRIAEGQENLSADVADMGARVGEMQARMEPVVEWDTVKSQELTNEVGGCRPGESCIAYLRGRRTPGGMACELDTARPMLASANGREFPVAALSRWSPPRTTSWETTPFEFRVPRHFHPGDAVFVVIQVFARCDFAENRIIERATFELAIQVSR